MPETATTLVGRTLARYRVVERLGEGGMGAVYRAWDERLQRDVALKVLSHELLERRDARHRLREEARLLSQLAHPAIATVYDFDAHDEIEFLVMELVRGQTLEQRIAAGPLPEAEVVDLALQICEALEAAHERGIIHRDLKPANVMVTARGRVKVLDFGLATCCMEDDTDDLSQASTRPLTLEGTVPYMSPEQLLGRPVDERTDVFSLGAVLYEMFSGVPPFAGATLPALTDAILRQPVAPLAQKRAGLAPGMAVAVERCLEKRVEDRYPDARALAEDLRRAAAGGAVEKPRRVRVARIRDPEAHRHYLRGRRQWSKRTRAGLMQAIEQFEAAIDLDPEHAQAYSGLADSYAILAPWLPPRLGHQKSRAAARRALELDPDSAEAHTSLAFTDLFADWNWTAAEAGFRRALQLDPTYATGHQWYAELLTALGRFDEALEQASAAEDLDALSYAMPTTLVNVFYYARRYDEALEHHRRMVALGSPDSGLGGIADRARILEQSGHAEEAVTEYRAALKLDDDPRIRAGLACALALAGHPSAARNEMALLESEAGVRHVPPYAIAGPLALLGDKDRAFERLEEAFTTRDRGMVWIRVNPRFDPLRDDARFASLLARMGFPG